jgi:hypothetical protein
MIKITGLPAPKSQEVTPVIRRMVRVTETKSRAMAIARKVLGVIICPPMKDLRAWENLGNASFVASACQHFGLLVLYFARFYKVFFLNHPIYSASLLILLRKFLTNF